jgi:hypothetical protein
MQKNRKIEKQVEATMNSLDSLQTARPVTFFFTRVQARIEREQNSQWDTISSFIARPAVAIAGIVFIVVLNAGALFYQKTHGSADMLRDQNEIVNADDYNTTVAGNFYYDENIESR